MGWFTKEQKKPQTYAAFPIREQMKGEVVLDKGNFPKEIGEKHPFDYSMTEGLYTKVSIVQGMIDKIVDFVWGPGFFIQSDDQRIQVLIEQWMDDVNFTLHGRRWLREALVKGTGYLEIGGKSDEIPAGIKILNANYMYINRDKKGQILEYIQAVTVDKRRITQENVTHFNVNQIAHISLNVCGDAVYGLGKIYPNITTINYLLQSDKDMHKLVSRKANSPMIVYMGDREKGEIPTSDAMEELAGKLTFMNNSTEYALPDNMRVEMVDFGKVGEKFTSVIEHDVDQLIYGFQVPMVLLGKGNVPEGLAKAQALVFERMIQSIQAELEAVIESKIINRLLLAHKLAGEVDFIWGQPNADEKNQRLTILQSLLTNQMITMRMREALEMEVMKLLDLDPEIVETDDEEREREETEPQPRVPGTQSLVQSSRTHTYQNQAIAEHFFSGETPDSGFLICGHCKKQTKGECIHSLAQYKCTECNTINEILDIPIKEYVGFNYDDFLDTVKETVKKDDFKDLRANNKQELEEGYLSKSKITSLKSVLINRFNKGGSMRDIQQDLLKKVEVKDLVITKAGEIVKTIPKEFRALQIARSEVIRISNKATLQNYRDASMQYYQWQADVITGMDLGRTCELCADMDGKQFPITGSHPLPPLHPMCRCTIIATNEAPLQFEDVLNPK